MSKDDASENNGRPNRRGTWMLWGFVAVAAYFLWTEHQAHVIQYLPFLMLLACPLMHLFHHGGHGRHGGHGTDGGESSGRYSRGQRK